MHASVVESLSLVPPLSSQPASQLTSASREDDSDFRKRCTSVKRRRRFSSCGTSQSIAETSLSDQLQFQQQHITHLEQQLSRCKELAALSQEQALAQIKKLKQSLLSKEQSILALQAANKKLSSEVAVLREELTHSQHLQETYFAQLEEIRGLWLQRQESLETSYVDLEAAYTKETGELLATVRTLQSENRTLAKLNHTHSLHLKHITALHKSGIEDKLSKEEAGLVALYGRQKQLQAKSKAEGAELQTLKRELRFLSKSIQARTRSLSRLKGLK